MRIPPLSFRQGLGDVTTNISKSQPCVIKVFWNNRSALRSSANDVYLETVERIVYSCYEIGSYCVDSNEFQAIKYLVECTPLVPRAGTNNWIYSLTSSVYGRRGHQSGESYGKTLEHTRASLARRLGWTDTEASRNMMQFEYLGNLYALCKLGKRDFPVHAAY